MGHYVITEGDVTHTVKGWDQGEAIEAFFDKIGRQWNSTDELLVDDIRPATVREAMSSEYGDDWAKHGPSHCFDLENNYHTDHRDVLIIRGTGNNDVHGYDDAVSVSNYRVLYDSWKDLEGLSRGPYSNIDMITLELDSQAPSDLTEVLDGLADYPVVDEQEWSSVEQEMIQEHWESYGKNDVMDAVAEAIAGPNYNRTDLTDYAETLIERLVWEGILDYGCGGGYPSMIDESACDFGEKEVAAWFKARLGLTVPLRTHRVFSAPGYESGKYVHLNRNNLVRSS